MDWEKIALIINSLSSLATILALIIGGIWAYLRFVRQVEYFPHIEFGVDIQFVGLQNSEWLVELQALINNKGSVRHEIHDFQFDLRYLKKSDKLQDGDEKIGHQTFIPHLLKEESWVEYITFVDPGNNGRYSYITTIPKDATFLLLHGRFRYKDENFFHTADKLIKVPTQNNKL